MDPTKTYSFGVPVLCYHKIVDQHDDHIKYSIPVGQFLKQMDYLASNGYETISPCSLFEEENAKKRNRIIISFDDGHYSDFSIAFQILKKKKFSGVFFVTTNYVGSKGYVTWSNLDEMNRCGMSIQSHSVSHPLLANIDENEVKSELQKSKEIIEDKLGNNVSFISFPGGSYNSKVLQSAKKFNYAGVFISKPGMNNICPVSGDLLVVKRSIMSRTMSDAEFRAVVHGSQPHMLVLQMKYLSKNGVKRFIGNSAYYYLWRRFFKNT